MAFEIPLSDTIGGQGCIKSNDPSLVKHYAYIVDLMILISGIYPCIMHTCV